MSTPLQLMVALALFLLTAVAVPSPSHGGGKQCNRKAFKTALVKKACKAGGQSAAKKAMKAWVKAATAKKDGLECESCHSSLAPDYPLTKNGLELFKQLGGK